MNGVNPRTLNTHAHTRPHAHTHAHAHGHTRTRTCAYTRARAHTHTHTRRGGGAVFRHARLISCQEWIFSCIGGAQIPCSGAQYGPSVHIILFLFYLAVGQLQLFKRSAPCMLGVLVRILTCPNFPVRATVAAAELKIALSSVILPT